MVLLLLLLVQADYTGCGGSFLVISYYFNESKFNIYVILNFYFNNIYYLK